MPYQFKLKLADAPEHSDVAASVSWTNIDELISCGDDHRLLKWNTETNDVSVLTELGPEVFPISISWPPKNFGIASAGRKTNDLLLMTTSDGKFYFIGRNGKIEKSVQAHQGAVINGSWSPDGSEILTSGEDGYLRSWSRTGMLRAVLAQCSIPIYCSSWGPGGNSVIYGCDKNLIHRPIAPGSKSVEWKAHDGLIISLAVSPISKLIVSGAEDGKYKIWNLDSHLIYSSSAVEFPITSLAWSPSGDMFTVGAYNMVRLCDKSGWSHHMENPKTGSTYALHWGSDGTQFAGATASGHVFVACVVGKSTSWKNYEAVIDSTKTVEVKELKNKTKDRLDFRERVTQISMNHGHLIIVFPTLAHIYSVQNIYSAVHCELKENTGVNCILQSKKNFVLCGSFGLTSRNYEGRVLNHIKWPGMQTELLNSKSLSLSDDMVAVADPSENKQRVRVFDVQSGKPLIQAMEYKTEILQIGLAQNEMFGPTERILAVMDKNNDVTLILIRRQGTIDPPKKLGSMIQSILWHSEAPVLATLRESKLRIYYFPQVIFVDSSLLDQTYEDKELGDLGRCPELISYDESNLRLKRSDGALIAASASYLSLKIHNYAMTNQFQKARRLCFYSNEPVFWGVLAGLALMKCDLDTAETCFAQINHFDKISFLKSLEETDDEVVKEAIKELFCHGISKGETVFLKAGKIKDAISLNVKCMKWERALELTLKYNEDIEDLVGRRQAYLDKMGIEEYIPELWTVNT